MKGRRLPDAQMGRPSSGWDEWIHKEPGTYMKVDTSQRGDWSNHVWFIRDPRGHEGTLGRAHTVTELEDGTISVTPSIAPNEHDPGGWHGHLKRGVWNEIG